MLGGPLRRYEDPAHSRDPRIREVVAALATLDPAPAPRAHFRAELRAQLVAVAPRLVQEGTEELAPRRAEAAPPKQPVKKGLISGLHLGRPLAAVACTVVILAMLLGGVVVLSRGSLPGDALYGVKRASENAQLAATSGAEAKAKLNLKLASTRFSEVAKLLPESPAAAKRVSSHTRSLVDSTLGSADSDLLSASQTLGAQAIRNNSAAPLDVLTKWAPGALSHLTSIINRLPAGDLRDRVTGSYTLLTSAFTRAKMLAAEAGCSCLHATSSDQLGPLPCPVCVSPAHPGVPGGSGPSKTPAVSTKPTAPVSSSTGAATGSTGSTGAGSSAAATGNGTGPSATATPTPTPSKSRPGLTLPTILSTLPSLPIGPIGIGSCGISVSLSPIILHLGSCPTTAHS
ncbi:MAG: hypothetical protein JWQ77_2046 [Jatrophihabitans sp.]|nr:hypothetical protein [Jatrophihabitans sp.]